MHLCDSFRCFSNVYSWGKQMAHHLLYATLNFMRMHSPVAPESRLVSRSVDDAIPTYTGRSIHVFCASLLSHHNIPEGATTVQQSLSIVQSHTMTRAALSPRALYGTTRCSVR